MTALIVTFPPERDEGPIGYFRRLAFENSYAGWRALIRAAGISPTINSLWKNQATVATALGLKEEWVSTVLPLAHEGIGLHDPYYLRLESEPICPQCLIEAAHLRHAWSHRFVTACPEHQCELIEKCPQCSTTLTNSRHDVAFCNCGYDLRYSKSVPARTVQCWVSARLAGDNRIVEGINEIGKPTDYIHLAELLFQLTVRFDTSVTVNPAKVIRPMTVTQSLKFLEPVLNMLEDLEPRFSEHIASRFQKGNLTKYSLAGRLGAWYSALHVLCCKHGAFPVVWSIFSNVAFDQFDGILRGQNKLTPSAGKERNYLSLQEAARHIDISVLMLLRGIELKQVSASICREGVNYSIPMISRVEADRLREERTHWISESQAATRLCVTNAIVDHLVFSGVLNCDAKWRMDSHKSGPIEAKSVSTLVERISSFVTEQSVQDSLKFNELTARRTVDIRALAALYKAIFNGEVRPIGHDASHALGGFVFALADVRKYLGSAALSNAMTLKQLEIATGWKYECISQWIALKFLESERVKLQGRASNLVAMSALARFRNTWLPISEIAASVGSKGSAITKLLKARGVQVQGQTNRENGERRGGLVLLSDLVRLAGLGPRVS